MQFFFFRFEGQFKFASALRETENNAVSHLTLFCINNEK